MNKNYKCITFLIILFIIILLLVVTNNTIIFDNSIYSLVRSISNDFIDSFFKVMTRFGNTKTILILLVLLNIFLSMKEKITVDILAITSCVSNSIIKFIVRRERPSVLRLIKQGGYSFPSGHTMISITVYGFLIYLVYKNINNKILKYLLIFLLSCLIFLICISRIYVGVHFASDIMAGFILGLAELLFIINLRYGVKKNV